MARSQIKRTGEQGAGLALAGLTLGRTAVILGILVIVLGLAISTGMHATMPMHRAAKPLRGRRRARPAPLAGPASTGGSWRYKVRPSRADYTP
jgi:hypothetical protein